MSLHRQLLSACLALLLAASFSVDVNAQDTDNDSTEESSDDSQDPADGADDSNDDSTSEENDDSMDGEMGNDDTSGPTICQLEIIEIPEQTIINYDPFVPGVAIKQIKFTVENSARVECLLSLQVSPPEKAPELEFTFTETGVIFELRPAEEQAVLVRTNVAGVYQATIPSATVTELIFEAVITKDAVAAAADHTLPIQFQLNSVADEALVNEEWVSNVVLRSLPRAQVNLSGTSGGFGEVGSMSVVDFGIAKTGATRSLFVQLRSNTRSKLTVESENKGVLKHKVHPKEAPPIEYIVELDKKVIDLSKKYEAEYDLPKTYAGQSVPLKLTLGDVDGAMAGKYNDIINFEFSPL